MYQGTYYYLKARDIGDEKRLFIGGVCSLYRLKEYSGHWVDDARTGQGTATYINGDSVQGPFLNGHPHGTVVVTFASSSKQRAARYEKGTRICWLEERRRGRRRSTRAANNRNSKQRRGSSRSSSRESSRGRANSPEINSSNNRRGRSSSM